MTQVFKSLTLSRLCNVYIYAFPATIKPLCHDCRDCCHFVLMPHLTHIALSSSFQYVYTWIIPTKLWRGCERWEWETRNIVDVLRNFSADNLKSKKEEAVSQIRSLPRCKMCGVKTKALSQARRDSLLSSFFLRFQRCKHASIPRRDVIRSGEKYVRDN